MALSPARAELLSGGPALQHVRGDPYGTVLEATSDIGGLGALVRPGPAGDKRWAAEPHGDTFC